jgi:hypothetical protein
MSSSFSIGAQNVKRGLRLSRSHHTPARFLFYYKFPPKATKIPRDLGETSKIKKLRTPAGAMEMVHGHLFDHKAIVRDLFH